MNKIKNFSKTKKTALLAALLHSLSLLVSLIYIFNLNSTFFFDSFVVIFIAYAIRLSLVWALFVKIDATPNKGWAIFSLILGLYILLAALLLSKQNLFLQLLQVLSGIAFITAFVFKIYNGNKNNNG